METLTADRQNSAVAAPEPPCRLSVATIEDLETLPPTLFEEGSY
jgi:hypothetical protein